MPEASVGTSFQVSVHILPLVYLMHSMGLSICLKRQWVYSILFVVSLFSFISLSIRISLTVVD